LKKCEMVPVWDELTSEIQKEMLDKKPFCLNKFYDY